jgi:hypothetical protein
MEAGKSMASRRNRREWERLVAEYRASGKSQREFAAHRGVSLSSLARWCGLVERGSTEQRAEVGFVEVVAAESERSIVFRESWVLRVGAAVVLELPDWPSPEYVARVARAYEAVCG